MSIHRTLSYILQLIFYAKGRQIKFRRRTTNNPETALVLDTESKDKGVPLS
jgi:hypothetical protein